METTLPNFIGIGVPKAGTTWLHNILNVHPQVYVPQKLKELNYFDQNYEKGITWYNSFFPNTDKASQYKAIGEISPFYVYKEEVAQRIQAMKSVKKIFLCLRNPIDRAYSNYWQAVRRGDYTNSFEDIIRDRPILIDWGNYSKFLKMYLKYFEQDAIHILIMEQMFKEPQTAAQKISTFLDIDYTLFPQDILTQKFNEKFIPKSSSVFMFMRKVQKFLNKNGLHTLTGRFKNVAKNAVKSKESTQTPPMNPETRKRLFEAYLPDIEELERMTKVDLGVWKNKETKSIEIDTD
jgi:hypothetical protein